METEIPETNRTSETLQDSTETSQPTEATSSTMKEAMIKLETPLMKKEKHRRRKRQKLSFDDGEEKRSRVGLLDLADVQNESAGGDDDAAVRNDGAGVASSGMDGALNKIAVKSEAAADVADDGNKGKAAGDSEDEQTIKQEGGYDIMRNSGEEYNNGAIQNINAVKPEGRTEQCQIFEEDVMEIEETTEQQQQQAGGLNGLENVEAKTTLRMAVESSNIAKQAEFERIDNSKADRLNHSVGKNEGGSSQQPMQMQSQQQQDGQPRGEISQQQAQSQLQNQPRQYLQQSGAHDLPLNMGLLQQQHVQSQLRVQQQQPYQQQQQANMVHYAQNSVQAQQQRTQQQSQNQFQLRTPQHHSQQSQQQRAQQHAQNTGQTQQQRAQQQPTNEPPGWRVKLYRLNQDGTWDDCGTGRIQFYFAKHHHGNHSQGQIHHSNQQQDQQNSVCQKKQDSTDNQSSSSSPTNQQIHQAIYRELGEPMLCMRAESHPNQQGENTPTIKVLLRTRVLLHDAYQCQGGNIITWCEPFHVVQKKEGSKQQHQGVDLALSFQENAGCKDVWRHILDVQLRAKELSHFWTRSRGGGSSPGAGAGNGAVKSLNVDVAATQVNSIQADHLQHHNHQPLSPGKHHGHLHQPLSPHSPDHDALEDRQLSMVTLPKHPPMWQGHSNGLQHSNSSQHQLRQQHLGQQQHRDDEKEEAQLSESDGDMSSIVNGAHNSLSQEEEGRAIDRSPSPLSLYYEKNSCSSNGTAQESQLSPSQLPSPPDWTDLKYIIEIIENCTMQHREDLLIFFSQSDCAYIKALLRLFHSKPEDELDTELGVLAVCIKEILLMNDPEIIEYVTTDEEIFESICGVLEYTPELQRKANYREFIRERAKFRTVVKMDDDELVSYIHRLFRVNYLKDFILRPTMEESNLSTLASLAQFTQSDIIKGVIHSVPQENDPNGLGESYFTKVLRVLGIEIKAIQRVHYGVRAASEGVSNKTDPVVSQNSSPEEQSPSIAQSKTVWSQCVISQDSSIQSRLARRKGCLSFLRELFSMARTSLQQQEKDEFIPLCVNTSVSICNASTETHLAGNNSQEPPSVDPPNEVNLLFLLGAILSDLSTNVQEKSAVLEILSVIAMHDPAIIRRYCIESVGVTPGEKIPNFRPEPDDLRQLIFLCPPHDLMQSLLLVMSTESDAGVLLQTSEIIRIILDTEMMCEQNSLDGGFMNDENEGSTGGTIRQNWNSDSSAGALESSEQNIFLSVFYERYIHWLFSPFLYKLLVPKVGFPLNISMKALSAIQQSFRKRETTFNLPVTPIPSCAMRLSFTFEILSFCVRAHVYRMKLYVLRSRLLSITLKVLSQKSSTLLSSDDRCLQLASLK